MTDSHRSSAVGVRDCLLEAIGDIVGSSSSDEIQPVDDVNDLIDEMDITIELIEKRLAAGKLSRKLRLELEWDVWILRGYCEHGLSYTNLFKAKQKMELLGELPRGYHHVKQEL